MVQRYRSIGSRMQEDSSGAYVSHSDYQDLTRQLAETSEKLVDYSMRLTDKICELAEARKALEKIKGCDPIPTANRSWEFCYDVANKALEAK